MSDDEDIEAYWLDVRPPAVEAPHPEPMPVPTPALVAPPFILTEEEREEALRLLVQEIGLAPRAPQPGDLQNEQFKPRNVALIRAMHGLWFIINIWLYGGLTSWHDGQWQWAWRPQWAVGQVLFYITGLVVAAAINAVEN